jgi:DNA invertase Pin-like site-specific DNA recombinase
LRRRREHGYGQPLVERRPRRLVGPWSETSYPSPPYIGDISGRLFAALATIAEKGAGFRSLADAWADTTTPHGRPMLTVLAGLAEFERELIRARTSEGRKRAKAAGVHMGRPPKLSRHQQREAIERRDAGETLTDIARSYGVSHTTIMRLTAAPDR